MEYFAGKQLLLVMVALVLPTTTTTAFEWHAPGQRPEVTRQAIAGLWKITPALLPKYPMKEFTVYPKKKQDVDDKEPELLLMLKEDGSFQEYDSDQVSEDEESVEESWKRYQEKQRQEKRKAELTEFMNSGTTDHEELLAKGAELQEVIDALEEKEMRWLELSEYAD